MKEVSIIGLGGIGSLLAGVISRFEGSLNDSTTINLIDGDEYELKNLDRQEFGEIGKNKATTKKEELQSKFRNIAFMDHPVFVTENNVGDFVKENSIVLLCVDNHKTRKIVDMAAEKLQNIVLISGGNELIDGNVQIFVKKGGEKITPSLSDYHKEIDNPEDKLPTELSCEELMNSEPQLLFTNLGVATCMTWAYRNALSDNFKFSEIYFDIDLMKVSSKERKPKSI